MATLCVWINKLYAAISNPTLYMYLTIASEICGVFRVYPTMYCAKVCIDMVREIQKISLFSGMITVTTYSTTTSTTTLTEGGPIMNHVRMYKYDGKCLIHELVVPSEQIYYSLTGWKVEHRKEVRPTPTPIPCTPLPGMLGRKHEYAYHMQPMVDEYITEDVDCGICGTIRLQWTLSMEHSTLPSYSRNAKILAANMVSQYRA
jgi:hypothetical protein